MKTAVTALAITAVALVLILQLIRKWRSCRRVDCPPCETQLVHRLCPHDNVVQSFQVEQKDSLDEHLDALTKKLAEKEGRLRLSKSRIRETQNEIDNLHLIDQGVKVKYREVMNSLKTDLLSNEKECKKLQEQIEWVSHRRAELRDEVRHSQKLYGEAAAELASNLTELRNAGEGRVTEKPHEEYTEHILSYRQEPRLPYIKGAGSIVIKTLPNMGSGTRLSHRIPNYINPIG